MPNHHHHKKQRSKTETVTLKYSTLYIKLNDEKNIEIAMKEFGNNLKNKSKIWKKREIN